MGPFPVIVLTACLNTFRWLLWAVATLLSVLLIVQKLRNDPDLRPGPELVAIAAFLLAGLLTGWVARRMSGLSGQLSRATAPVEASSNAMAEVRQTIDELDDELVHLLARRQRQIEKAAVVKTLLGIPARVPERVDEVLARVDRAAKREGLAPEVAFNVWNGLIEWSIAYEERLMEEAGGHDLKPDLLSKNLSEPCRRMIIRRINIRG